MTVPLCPSCCNRASEMCRDSCAEGPVVECSRHGVTEAPVVLARACSLCLGAPAPGETCRACGGQGAPFIASEVEGGWSQPRPEFQVGCECGELRAENARLRERLKQIAEWVVRKQDANPCVCFWPWSLHEYDASVSPVRCPPRLWGDGP